MIKYKKILYKPQFSASDPFIFLHALLQKIVNNWIPIRRYYFCIISFFSHQNINASLKRFLMRWCLLQHPSNKTSLKISIIYCRLAKIIPPYHFCKGYIPRVVDSLWYHSYGQIFYYHRKWVQISLHRKAFSRIIYINVQIF